MVGTARIGKRRSPARSPCRARRRAAADRHAQSAPSRCRLTRAASRDVRPARASPPAANTPAAARRARSATSSAGSRCSRRGQHQRAPGAEPLDLALERRTLARSRTPRATAGPDRRTVSWPASARIVRRDLRVDIDPDRLRFGVVVHRFEAHLAAIAGLADAAERRCRD